jgi:hypothetical protein
MTMKIQQYNMKKNRKTLSAQTSHRILTAGGVLEIMNKPLIANLKVVQKISLELFFFLTLH